MHVNNTVEECESLTRQKSKLGIRLFFLYLISYVGFVFIGLFQYELLSVTVFAGLNLVLVYGIGLIVFAVIMIYDISYTALIFFFLFVELVLGLSFYFGRK